MISRFRKTGAWAVAICCLAPVSLWAQSVRVLSEFKRVDPTGEILPEDATGSTREVLSPAVPRNAFSSFRIVTEVPRGIPSWLYIGVNPENSVRVTLYKEAWEKRDGRWVPDRLQLVKLPYNGLVPEAEIPEQTVESFLLDVWVDASAPVRRIRVEAQLWVPDRWIIYPMELRIVAAKARQINRPKGSLQPVEAALDATAQSAWRGTLCESPAKGGEDGTAPAVAQVPTNVRSIVLRNARQDLAIAPAAIADIWSFLGIIDTPRYCKSPLSDPAGPETYLRLRDRLLRRSDLP